MATYSITEMSDPLYTYSLEITSSINVSQVYQNENINTEEKDSQAFNNIFNLAASNIENAYKTLPEFTTQDNSRNCTWTYVDLGNNYYSLSTSFTIQNAAIKLNRNTSTDLQGQEKDDYLQAFADDAIAEYKATYGWIDL